MTDAMSGASREMTLTEVVESLPTFHRARRELVAVREKLDRLARLGNEPSLGNSNGNAIAQDALEILGPPTEPSEAEVSGSHP